MRGALRRGQPACLVTPSHPKVARRPSLRRRPSRFRNLRVPSPCAPLQAGSLSLICPGQRRNRTDPQSWWPWGAPVGSSLHPSGDIQRRVSLASCLDGKRGKEILPLTAPSRAHLGIIKSVPGKKTAGATGLLDPKCGDPTQAEGRVLYRGGWLQIM